MLAAVRAGAARVILPEGNRPEADALAADETAGVEVAFVKGVFEALALAGA